MSQLFRNTAQAHHTAFSATDGADPDWPIWYADHLRDKINNLLGSTLTRSQLIYCLMFVDFERRRPGEPGMAHESLLSRQ